MKDKPFHLTSRIPLSDFEPGYLKPGNYAIEDLSRVIINHLSRNETELTATQLRGLKRYKYNGSWNLAERSSYTDLRNWFDIFNDILFNGTLTGFCNLIWYPTGRATGPDHCGGGYCKVYKPGSETDPRFRIEKTSVEIGLQDLNYPIYYKLGCYLAGLAHQMLHAFFYIYTCSCVHGCAALNGTLKLRSKHHSAFLSALRVIERAVHRSVKGGTKLLRLECDFNIKYWSADVFLNVAPLPCDAELRNMGFGINNFLQWRDQTRRDCPFKTPIDKLLLGDSRRRNNACIAREWTVDAEERHELRTGELQRERQREDRKARENNAQAW